MTTQRKKHAHPVLVPPRTIPEHFVDGNKIEEKYLENDHGRMIDGRVYSYHPTRGWRNTAVHKPINWENKNRLVQLVLHAAVRKGIAV